MANPAVLLHEILESFRTSPNAAPINTRRERYPSEDAMNSVHRRAMAHIAAIEELLAGLEASGRRVQQYQRALNRWQQWVMVYGQSWIHPISSNVFDNEADLDLLAALADTLELVVPAVAAEERQSLREATEVVQALLEEDTDLPSDLRRHIFGLLSHARTCLDEYETFGDFELRSAMERLLVSVTLAGNVSQNTKWQAAKEKFWFPTISGLIIGAPANAAAMITALSSTPGAGG